MAIGTTLCNLNDNPLVQFIYTQTLTLALHKSVPLGWEDSNIEFRIEAFNALNSTNFQFPDTTVTDGASFGTYTASNAYPAREVQLALRFSF